MTISIELILLCMVIAFFGGWIGTRAVRGIALKRNVIDVPNERSSHSVPTPRGGGLAVIGVMSLLLIALIAFGGLGPVWLAILVPALAVSATGWWDDASGLSAGFRLLVQMGMAVVALGLLASLDTMVNPSGLSLGFVTLNSSVLVFPFLLLFVVWLTNLYNFMDGIDGILATQGATVGVSAAVLAWIASEPELASFYATVAAALSGFLILNWSPAKIFMGDVGSAFLGFIFSLAAILGAALGDLGFPAAIVLHAMFIGDATYTLIRRLLRGQKPHQAHRSHFYQHMTRMGWTHARVSLLFGAINLLVLLPLAWAMEKLWIPGWAGILMAFMPPLVLCVRYRAGIEV